MKNKFPGTIILVGTLIAAVVTPVSAEPLASGPYVGVSGVASFVGDMDVNNSRAPSIDHTVQFDPGFGALVRAGYRFGAFRTDVELGYRNVDVDSINKNGTARANAEGNADIYTAMLNGTYDVDLDVPVVPYISVGVGALGASGHTKFTRTSGTPQGNNADGITFAGQLGLGLGYEVAPGVSLLGGYSVLAAPTEQIGTNEVILIHNAQVGLNYQF